MAKIEDYLNLQKLSRPRSQGSPQTDPAFLTSAFIIVAVDAWLPAPETHRENSLSLLLGFDDLAARTGRRAEGKESCVGKIISRQKQLEKPFIKNCYGGLPWWRSGWESACQCRGHGFEPWSGKIPHAAEQLGPWATITEPAHLEPVLRNKRGRDNERPAHCDEERPPLAATRESPRTETKTQHSHK